TTRDLINEVIQFAGMRINLIDTAGIGEPGCEIEEKGINLSRKKIESSSIVIMVLDVTAEITDQDREILEGIKDKKNVILANKIDLASKDEICKIESVIGSSVIPFSAKTGAGLAELEKVISDIIRNEFVDYENSFVADIRVVDLLEESLNNIESCEALLSRDTPQEIVAIELQALIDTLKEITGEISPDDVLNSIFSRFCIGK
ncbi:MAG: GTP-binding protein, partial [bacterium]|nr:GTP-binding protein [bacterium]